MLGFPSSPARELACRQLRVHSHVALGLLSLPNPLPSFCDPEVCPGQGSGVPPQGHLAASGDASGPHKGGSCCRHSVAIEAEGC